MAIGKHKVRVIAIVAVAVAIVVAWYGWHRSQHGGGGGGTGGSTVAIPDRDDGPASGALARGGALRNTPTAIDPMLTPLPVSIAGRVLDATTHTPVAGVDVELVGVAKGAGDIIATSDSSGGYKADVTTGAWDVRASGAGVIAAPVRVIVATTSGVIAHDVLVDRAAMIHGHVLDDTGAPVGGASVTIEDTGASVTAGGDGAYEIEGPPGQAKLRADADVGTGFAIAGATPGGDAAVDIVIPAPVTIDGKVVDDHGPVAGAEVSAIARNPGGVVRLTATSDGAGGFRIQIQPGAIALEARHDGAGTSGTTRLTLNDAGGHADVTLTLVAEVALAGTVTDANGPIAGARVHARLAGAAALLPTAISDGDGHFAVQGARAGHYAIEAVADGAQARMEVDVAADSPPIQLVLAATGGIHGIVTFDAADSTQVQDVTVEIAHFVPSGDDHDGRAPFTKQTYAGADGFRIGELPAGRYDLIVTAAGHAPGHADGVEVKEGAWTEITVNLDSSALLILDPALFGAQTVVPTVA